MFSLAKNKLRTIRRKWRLLRSSLAGSGSRKADQPGKLLDEPETVTIVATSTPTENKLALQDGALDAHTGLTYEDAPIAVLPFDVLRIIFDLYAHDSDPYEDYRRSVRRCWMRLTHVCTTWRSVLLDMPLLWARDVCAFGVKDEPGRPFRIMLTRARGAPLDLDLSCKQWMQLGREEQLGVPADLHLPLFTRARQLILRAETPREISALLNAMSGRPLPQLEEFALNVYCLNPTSEWPATLDGTATLDGAENLRELCLRGVYMRPPANGGLVTLIISIPGSYETYRPPADELLHILAQNPGFSELFLKDAFSSRGRSTAMRSSSVVLPSMLDCKIIQVRENEQLHAFLDCLRMPNVHTCQIEGNYDDDSMGTSHKPTLLQAALAACAGSPALLHKALDVTHKPDELEIWVHLCWDEMDPPGFRFSGYPRGRPAAVADAAVGLLSDAHIFENVLNLSVAVYGLQTDAVKRWAPAVARCTSAEGLSLSASSAPSAVAVLGLVEVALEAGASLSRRRYLGLSNQYSDDILDDGSGEFQAICDRAKRLDVTLYVWDKFKPRGRKEQYPNLDNGDKDEDEGVNEDEGMESS